MFYVVEHIFSSPPPSLRLLALCSGEQILLCFCCTRPGRTTFDGSTHSSSSSGEAIRKGRAPFGGFVFLCELSLFYDEARYEFLYLWLFICDSFSFFSSFHFIPALVSVYINLHSVLRNSQIKASLNKLKQKNCITKWNKIESLNFSAEKTTKYIWQPFLISIE